MGLSLDEQQEIVARSMNDVCYGAFRYPWRNCEDEERCKELVRELWQVLAAEFGLSIDKANEIIGAGRIFNIGALEDLLDEGISTDGESEVDNGSI